jgi:CheY-like chemotaxis protein
MRRTILVVDDDPGVRRCLGEFLESEGYKVLSASNGRAALAVLEEVVPNVLIVDIAMPVMSGPQLMEALAHYPDLARIPLILMSNGDDLADIKSRTHRVLAKPLNLGWVATAVAATAAAA